MVVMTADWKVSILVDSRVVKKDEKRAVLWVEMLVVVKALMLGVKLVASMVVN
jgi:hypothetical protein